MKKKLIIVSLLSMGFAACINQQENSNSDTEDTVAMELSGVEPAIDQVKVATLTQTIIEAIPSSEEVSSLMQEMGKEYQMDLLNPIEHVSKYQLVSDKAVNLGIYLCDLGYISSFDQTQELIFYINCSKKLSEGIGVHEVVDEATIENLELNIDNPDSLQAIINRIYNETYDFLSETNKLSTATLMVSGGWIEGLYIAMQLIDLNNPNLEMIENLIRQQEVYDHLMELLNNFENDSDAKLIHERLASLGPVLKKIGADAPNQPQALAELKEKITSIRNKCIAY